MGAVEAGQVSLSATLGMAVSGLVLNAMVCTAQRSP